MEITQCLACPMILSPFPLIFFSGLLNFLDMSTLYYSFEILLYSAACMCIGAVASVGYRIATLLDSKCALSMFNHPRCVIIWHIVGHIVAFCFVYFLFELRRENVLNAQVWALQEAPYLDEFVQKHKIIGKI